MFPPLFYDGDTYVNIEGVIFDFNGVLLWDTALHETAWQQFASKILGRPLTEPEIQEHIHGRNNRHTLEFILGRSLDNNEVSRYTKVKELIYQNLAIAEKENYQLSPGAISLLTYLKNHQIPYTIATASPELNLDFYFKTLGLSEWFDRDLIIYDDGSRPGKPDPAFFLAAAAKIGVSFGQCALIEDSISGLKAAYFGCAGEIIALGEPSKHDHLKQNLGVTHVISQLDELIPLLEIETAPQ